MKNYQHFVSLLLCLFFVFLMQSSVNCDSSSTSTSEKQLKYKTAPKCPGNPPPGCQVKDCKRDNEVFVCGGSPCQTFCRDLNRPCCKKTTAPVNDCYCKKGYARNAQGRCIPIDSCECKNEILPPCVCGKDCPDGPVCDIKECKGVNEEFICGGGACQIICANLNRPCCIYTFAPVNACYCKKGFAKNKYGVCIPINCPDCQKEILPPCVCGKDCDSIKPIKDCNRDNEIFVYGGSPCQRTCRDLKRPCCIQTIAPVDDCYCIDGYARNMQGKCIPIDSTECKSETMPTCVCGKDCPTEPVCPIQKCNDENEVYICGGSTCQLACYGLDQPCCIVTIAPVDACYCKKGLARNKYGKCIPICSTECQKEKLPKCTCGQEGCGNPFGGTSTSSTSCSPSSSGQKTCCGLNQPHQKEKQPKCKCGSNCKCGPNCPGNPPSVGPVCDIKECPCGEEFIFGGSPCQTTCANLNKPCLIRTFAPVNDCYCKEGLARDKNGKCIKISSPQCQKEILPSDECETDCPGETTKPIIDCKRDKEIFIYGAGSCQRTCAGLKRPCCIQTLTTVNECCCIEGYARNIHGKCIRIDSTECQQEIMAPCKCGIDCGDEPVCHILECNDANEEYICAGSNCQLTCYGLDLPCCIKTKAPVKACYCKKGYARNKYGKCIPICCEECQKEKLPKCLCSDEGCMGLPFAGEYQPPR